MFINATLFFFVITPVFVTAEDEDFVVWNMLSDKDIPSRDDDSEEEDDYFMEYCWVSLNRLVSMLLITLFYNILASTFPVVFKCALVCQTPVLMKCLLALAYKTSQMKICNLPCLAGSSTMQCLSASCIYFFIWSSKSVDVILIILMKEDKLSSV